MSHNSKKLEDILSVTKGTTGLQCVPLSTIHIVSEMDMHKENVSPAEKALDIVLDVASKTKQTLQQIVTNGFLAFVEAAKKIGYEVSLFNKQFTDDLAKMNFSF